MFRDRGGRERRDGMGNGLDGRSSVLRCLNGGIVVCGRVGRGGKASVSEMRNGEAGAGGSGASSNECSLAMEEGVRRLP